MRTRTLTCLVVGVLAPLLVACGSGADSPMTSPSAMATPIPTGRPTPVPPPPPTPTLTPEPPPAPTQTPEPTVTPDSAGEAYPAGSVGYAISWPQCGSRYPAQPFDFGIIGVTDGSALTHNPCFGGEYRWAKAGRYRPSIYMNTNLRKANLPSPNPPGCDDACVAYQYGRDSAQNAYEYAASEHAVAPVWWLDVQIVSSWAADHTLNARAVEGAADFLVAKGIRVGISSTSYQWGYVAGDAQQDLPVWDASALGPNQAAEFCRDGKDFGGGRTEQIAWVDRYETVLACGPG